MNCAYNAISAVTQARYILIRENALARDVMRELIEEVVAVGTAAGVAGGEGEAIAPTVAVPCGLP